MSQRTDLIEELRHQEKHGESSLGTLYKVFSFIGRTHKELYDKFATQYEEFANEELDFEEGIIDEVCRAIEDSPEPIKPKGLLD